MRCALFVVFAALVGSGCDNSGEETTRVATMRAPELLVRSLTAAREKESVEFELELELGMKAGRSFEFVFEAAGVRTPDGVSAEGTADGEPFELVEADGVLFLRLDGSWYETPTNFRTLVDSESLMSFIPASACIDGGTGGCRRIDLDRPLRDGSLGRLLSGRVRAVGDEWQLEGTLDAAGFARLVSRHEPRYYRPYETNGRARYVVGRDDLLPRELEYSYALDRAAIAAHLQEGRAPAGIRERTGRISIRFSDWGTDVEIEPPDDAAAIPRARVQRMFDVFFSFFGSYI